MTTISGYEATRQSNGDLTVHNVPIFLECERGDFHADEEWITKAFQQARLSHDEGYLPPLHIWHHEYDVRPRRAGHFEITHLAPHVYRGQNRLTLFADLTFTDEWAQEDVLARRLPYRSVEICDVEKPEINSLALLDTEAPYLQLPMLTIADVNVSAESPQSDVAYAAFDNPWRARQKEDRPPLVVCFSRGARPFLLTEEPEDMATAKNKPGTPAPKDGGKTTGKPARSAAFKDGEDGDGEDKKDGDGENMEAEGGSGLDVDGVCAAVESGEISVADMEKLLAAIQARMGGVEEEPEEPAEDVAAPAMVPGGESMKNRPTAESVKLQAQVDALQAKLEARDEADSVRADVAWAMKRLEGRPLGSDLEKRLGERRKTLGSAHFRSIYVEDLARSVGKTPASAGGEHFGAIDEGTPDIAMKYSELGPEAVAFAARAAQEWQQLRRSGLRSTQDAYVAHQMAGFGSRN